MLLYSCASCPVARVSTCAIFANDSSRIPRCAHDTRRVMVKSIALWDSVRGAARDVAEPRVQITSVVSGIAHETCSDSASRLVHRVHVQQCVGLRIALLHTSRNSGNENNAYCTRSRVLQLAALRVYSSYHEQISSSRSTHRANLEKLASMVLETRRCNNLRFVALSAHCSTSRGCCSRHNSHHNCSSRLRNS